MTLFRFLSSLMSLFVYWVEGFFLVSQPLARSSYNVKAIAKIAAIIPVAGMATMCSDPEVEVELLELGALDVTEVVTSGVWAEDGGGEVAAEDEAGIKPVIPAAEAEESEEMSEAADTDALEMSAVRADDGGTDGEALAAAQTAAPSLVAVARSVELQ